MGDGRHIRPAHIFRPLCAIQTTIVRVAPPAATTPDASGKKGFLRGRKPSAIARETAIAAAVALLLLSAVLNGMGK